MFKHYRSAAIFTVLAVIAAFFIGGLPVATVVLILGVLETSLSFDNAVVNASVLKNWGPLWRHRFLTWGMPIAVFGMRLVFPLLIVGIVAGIGPIQALMLAINSPKDYEVALTSCANEISAFGGTFLMMVFLKFFFDQEKEVSWIGFLERPLAAVGRLDMASAAIALLAVLGTSHFIADAEKVTFIIAGVAGLISYIAADAVGTLVGGEDNPDGTSRIIKEGIGGFVYLEVLDSSFSFDGVIASFALTNAIFVIALGLGIGAMFVRSMTLHLVETGKLSEFRYLEHGAFWAIGALSTIMFLSTFMHVSEVVTGLIGAASIGLALWTSMVANKRELATA